MIKESSSKKTPSPSNIEMLTRARAAAVAAGRAEQNRLDSLKMGSFVTVMGVRSNSQLGKDLALAGFVRNNYIGALQMWVRTGSGNFLEDIAYASAYAGVLKACGLRALENWTTVGPIPSDMASVNAPQLI